MELKRGMVYSPYSSNITRVFRHKAAKDNAIKARTHNELLPIMAIYLTYVFS